MPVENKVIIDPAVAKKFHEECAPSASSNKENATNMKNFT